MRTYLFGDKPRQRICGFTTEDLGLSIGYFHDLSVPDEEELHLHTESDEFYLTMLNF